MGGPQSRNFRAELASASKVGASGSVREQMSLQIVILVIQSIHVRQDQSHEHLSTIFARN